MRSLAIVFLLLAACAPESRPPPNVETVKLEPLGAASASPDPSPKKDAPDAGADPHYLELVVGAIGTLGATNVRSFSVANDNIDVRPTPDGKSFVIAGKKKGRCDLLLIHKDGTQEIFKIEVFDR